MVFKPAATDGLRPSLTSGIGVVLSIPPPLQLLKGKLFNPHIFDIFLNTTW